MSAASDRATVVATAVLQIVLGVFRVRRPSPADVARAHAAIAAQLRNEFAEIKQTTANEIRPRDG